MAKFECVYYIMSSEVLQEMQRETPSSLWNNPLLSLTPFPWRQTLRSWSKSQFHSGLHYFHTSKIRKEQMPKKALSGREATIQNVVQSNAGEVGEPVPSLLYVVDDIAFR